MEEVDGERWISGCFEVSSPSPTPSASLQEETPAACGHPRAWEPSGAPQTELHHVVLIKARKKLSYRNEENFRAGLAGGKKSQASL